MASGDLLLAFFAATIVYALVPGPGTAYVATQAVLRDRSAALLGALGLHVGGYAAVIASSAGLTLLFEVVPVLYDVLKFVGAAYLVWLGVRTILGARQRRDDGVEARPGKYPATFAQGVLVEILNPTTVFFYVAFLPQFIDPAGAVPVWAQFAILGVIVNVIFSLGDLAAVMVASMARRGVSRSGAWQIAARWLGGSALIGLGVRLAS